MSSSVLAVRSSSAAPSTQWWAWSSSRPSATLSTRSEVFGSLAVDYTLVLNLVALAVFTALFWLTARRGATDPVCGMKVDRAKAHTARVGGRTVYFCSTQCLEHFSAASRSQGGRFSAPSDRVDPPHSNTKEDAWATARRESRARPRR